jgi:hypothetical protein
VRLKARFSMPARKSDSSLSEAKDGVKNERDVCGNGWCKLKSLQIHYGISP